MMKAPSPSRFSLVPRAGRAALQWRLLLLWAGCLLAPAALLALPMWRLLGASFDYSVHAAALAQEVDLSSLADLLGNYSRTGGVFPIAAAEALMLTLLLSPLLSGMAMSAARAAQPQGFGALIAGGLHEYPRMARMLLLAVIPLGVAAGLGAAAMAAASKYGAVATLQSAADGAGMLAMLVFSLLLMLAHATLDAGRATLALDRRRRSAVRAWWDGCKLLKRRPLAMFGVYLPITLAGLALAALLSLARIHLPAVSTAALIGAFLLTQLIVVVLAWMRTARLFAMVELARAVRTPLNSGDAHTY
jgi:hypothetical protein